MGRRAVLNGKRNLDRFVYVTGAPRSGTTFVLETLNRCPELLLLNEFPIYDHLFSGPLYSQFRVIEKTLDDLIVRAEALVPEDSGYAGTALADQVKGNTTFNVHDKRLANFCIEQIFALHARKQSSFRNFDRVKYHGLKLPGVFVTRDFELLKSLFLDFRVVAVFRDPYAVCLSSMKRFYDTLIGIDSWHISDVKAAVDEWIRNFYFQMYVRDLVGHDKFSLILFETMDTPEAWQAVSAFLEIGPITVKGWTGSRIPQNSEVVKLYADQIRGLLAKAKVPFEEEWSSLTRNDPPGGDLFTLRPVLLHEADRIDFTTPDHPGIVFGFDVPEPNGCWMVNVAAHVWFHTPEAFQAARLTVILSAVALRDGTVTIRLNNGTPMVLASSTQGYLTINNRELVHRTIRFDQPLVSWNKLTMLASHTTQIEPDPRPLVLQIKSLIMAPLG